MRPLNQADWAALNQAVRRLYAAESMELLRQTTLQELDRLVPGLSAAFRPRFLPVMDFCFLLEHPNVRLCLHHLSFPAEENQRPNLLNESVRQ
jgi:hypothetical protein